MRTININITNLLGCVVINNDTNPKAVTEIIHKALAGLIMDAELMVPEKSPSSVECDVDKTEQPL